MSTRKTSVTVDEELLDQARQVLKTDTIKETINGALLEVVRAEARREEVEALRSMDGLDLDDEDVMDGAWRQ